MSDSMQETLRSRYGAVADSTLSGAHEGVRQVAEAFGYSADELAAIPAAANMGLSCGNPLATANLRPGEVVVDLGCGGGMDVFLAASKVAPGGRAIGIDMTPAMIARAKQNAAGGASHPAVPNVEFHLASIDQLPLADASVDVVISNCVINLTPDKEAVFREIFRVLRPGGRVAVSDIALKQPLPDRLRNDVMAFVGCIAGAIAIDDYTAGLKRAGFKEVAVVDAGSDLNAYALVEGQSVCCPPPMLDAARPAASGGLPVVSAAPPANESGCCGGVSCAREPTTVHRGLSDLLRQYNVNDYAASVRVFAVKA